MWTESHTVTTIIFLNASVSKASEESMRKIIRKSFNAFIFFSSQCTWSKKKKKRVGEKKIKREKIHRKTNIKVKVNLVELPIDCNLRKTRKILQTVPFLPKIALLTNIPDSSKFVHSFKFVNTLEDSQE